MTDETLDSIAADLVAIPPRPVDPDVLAQADPDVLAAALRRAVADLPANEQRTRLAAAFSAMSPTIGETDAEPAVQGLEAELIGATHTLGMARPEDKPLVSPATAGLLALRPFTAVKAGALAGIAVIALLAGVLAGVITEDDPVEQLAVPGAAEQPIGVLEPVGHGDTPPTDAQVAAMSLPDPAAQIEAAEAAAAADPEVFEEAGIDPADTALVSDPNFDPYLSGYVDDPGGDSGPRPGDLADPDEPDAAVIPRDTSDGDTSDGDTTDSDTTDSDTTPETPDEGTSGDGDTSGPPAGDSPGDDADDGALVDLCAGDLPPVQCDGVGGTVTLAIVEPFAFIEDPLAFTTWPPCAGDDVELADDEFVIYVATNNLGSFTVRYRIAGTDDEFQTVTGSTDEIWREAMISWTNTCMVAQRPTQEATQLEVQITGVGEEDSGTATFGGVLDLDVSASGALREGRPRVRVEPISASEFDVHVPIGRDEKAEVTLVQRDPAGRATCDAPVVAEGHEAVMARTPGGITLDPTWRTTRFRLSVEDPGYFAICVLWTDTFTPPTEVERAVITLDVPDVTSTTFLYARYDQNACMGGGCPSTPLIAVAQVTPRGGDTCHGRLYKGGYNPTTPVEMCTVSGIPDRRLLLTTLSGFSKDGDYIRYDGEQGRVVAEFDPECDEATCTTWYSVPVRAPGGFFEGNGGIVGRALVGVRINGGTAGVVIGEEAPQVIDNTTLDGPRLDWSSVDVRLDPEDPARSIIVDWKSDRPVTLTVKAEDTTSHESSCSAVSKSTTTFDVEGTMRLTGLCPETLHYVSFRLTDEDGRPTMYNALQGPRRGGVDFIQQSFPIQTEALAVVYDYELTFKEYQQGTRNEITGYGVIPTMLYLELPGHTAVDYRQLYYGEPYFGTDCADPAHFNQSGSGVRLDLSGGTFRIPETQFELQTYRPEASGIFDSFDSGDRVCPSMYNQGNHTPSIDSLTCYFSIRNFVPQRERTTRTNDIDHLLAGGEGKWVATVDSRCANTRQITTLEATLTVRLRPA